MKHRVRQLEKAVGRGRRPFTHLTDEELQAATDRLRRGEPSGVTLFADEPSEHLPPTGLEHLSDEELVARLEAMRVALLPRAHAHRRK